MITASDDTPNLLASPLNMTVVGIPAMTGVVQVVVGVGAIIAVVVHVVVGTAFLVSQVVVSSSQSQSSVVILSGHSVEVLIGPQGSVTT
jgi:uncharacterized membrane protein YuzA (DUF378 family)